MNLITPEYDEWGRTVKKALIDKRMTVSKLAQQFQMPRTHLASVINGRHPREDIIRRISEYLGIDTP